MTWTSQPPNTHRPQYSPAALRGTTLGDALFILYYTPLLEWSARGQLAYAAAADITPVRRPVHFGLLRTAAESGEHPLGQPFAG